MPNRVYTLKDLSQSVANIIMQREQSAQTSPRLESNNDNNWIQSLINETRRRLDQRIDRIPVISSDGNEKCVDGILIEGINNDPQFEGIKNPNYE